MLPRRICLHSASSVLAVRISCRVIAVFVFREPLFINQTLPYLCLLHEYHVIYIYIAFGIILERITRVYGGTPVN
jgi:hypothetical protein